MTGTTFLVRGAALAALAIVWIATLTHRGSLPLAVISTLVLIGVARLHDRALRAAALHRVQRYRFPVFLRAKVRETYPQLDDAALADIERGLRQFFAASLQAEGRFVAMPSKAADALWHEFILHTRGYEAFCRDVFGRLLHHTPSEAMPEGRDAAAAKQLAGLRRAWYWSCKEEGLDPRGRRRLPLLFALDGRLAIPGGYRYKVDCRIVDGAGTDYCAAGLGCGSSCGSACGGGHGSGGSCGGDAGGCGGGASGCGGGCGGGD